MQPHLMHNLHNDRSGTAEDKKSCYQFSAIYTAKIKQTFVYVYTAKLTLSLFRVHLHSFCQSQCKIQSLSLHIHTHNVISKFSFFFVLHTTWFNQHYYLLELLRKCLFCSAIAYSCLKTGPCTGTTCREDRTVLLQVFSPN